jgi:hypothetical protein
MRGDHTIGFAFGDKRERLQFPHRHPLEREEEPKPRKETVRGDLGQTEAELEKAGEEQMEHMEGEEPKQ